MKKLFPILFLIACSSSSTIPLYNDAATGGDLAYDRDAGAGASCSGNTCGPGSICMIEVGGPAMMITDGGNGPNGTCFTIPPECTATPNCSCLKPKICPNDFTCTDQPGELLCDNGQR